MQLNSILFFDFPILAYYSFNTDLLFIYRFTNINERTYTSFHVRPQSMVTDATSPIFFRHKAEKLVEIRCFR